MHETSKAAEKENEVPKRNAIEVVLDAKSIATKEESIEGSILQSLQDVLNVSCSLDEVMNDANVVVNDYTTLA